MKLLSNISRTVRNITNFKTGRVAFWRFLSRRASQESRNPLVGLTPQRARALYELYRQGKFADVMLCWDALEETDDMLGTVVDRRASALAEMTDDVKVNARAVGKNTTLKALAAEQQQCLAEYYGRIENLRDAVRFMGLATFRGYSHLEPVATGRNIRLEPVPQWLMARMERGGEWFFNKEANASCARLEEVDMARLIVRECSRPVDLTAMFAICAKAHAMDGWDGFVDVFGNPAIFFEYPPNTSDERAREYDEIAEKIIGDGRGGYPSGGKISTVETTARGGDTFKQRAEWCDKQILRRATGGELTVMAESGTGTLAGGAHEETFRMLAAGEGAEISESFNRQLSNRLLDYHFPGQPHLAYWTLEYEQEEDTTAKVTNIATLASAGYRAKDEEVSEATGINVSSANMDPTALYAVKSVGYRPEMQSLESRVGMPLENVPMSPEGAGGPISNRMYMPFMTLNRTADEAPLTSQEIALLEKLSHAMPSADVINQESKALKKAMESAAASVAGDEPEKGESPVATPLQIPNSGHREGEEGLLKNYGTSEGAKKGWDKRGRGRRDDWQKAREGMTPRQNASNATRAMRWAMNNGRDAQEVMHRKGLGWVDFPIGRPGTPKKNDKGITHADGYGLSHILAKHGDRAVRRMPLILAYGKIVKHPDPDKVTVTYGNERVHLGRSKGRGRSWAITSYDESKEGKKNDY